MTTMLTRPRIARTVTCPPPTNPAPTTPAGMGQAVADGPLRFVALNVFRLYDAWCYTADYVRAGGQFLYVTVEVTNVGAQPHTFVADYQRLVDARGHIVRPDIRTMSLAAARRTTRFLDIGPGATTRSLLIFDVADRTQETDYRLTLHSSMARSTACVRLAHA